MFGVGLVFVTFSQVSHIPCMVARWRPDYHDIVDRGWARFQVEHSMNFAPASTLAFYISFGLNFQCEHHLFPSISHDHLPLLAPRIRRVCEKHGVAYWSEPSLVGALKILWDALVAMRDADGLDAAAACGAGAAGGDGTKQGGGGAAAAPALALKKDL